MSAFTKPVLLIGRENMNRAVHGDVVVIKVFDEKAFPDAVLDRVRFSTKGLQPKILRRVLCRADRADPDHS